MSWKAKKSQVDLAFSVAENSPDPYIKVGAVGFDMYEDVVATGFNTTNPFAKEAFWLDRAARRPFMIHAEQNLVMSLRANNIIQRNEALPMVFVVVNLFPCVSCMNLLAVFQIQRLCYVKAYQKDVLAFQVAKWHGIQVEQVPDYGHKFDIDQ